MTMIPIVVSFEGDELCGKVLVGLFARTSLLISAIEQGVEKIQESPFGGYMMTRAPPNRLVACHDRCLHFVRLSPTYRPTRDCVKLRQQRDPHH